MSLLISCPHGNHSHGSQAQVDLCGKFKQGWRLAPGSTGLEPPEESLKNLIPPEKTMSKEIKKSNGNQVFKPVTIFDEESKTEVEVTEAMHQKAFIYHTEITMSCLVKSFRLKTMRDEKLYLSFGFNSMKQYLEEHPGLSYRHGKKLLRIADRFGQKFPDMQEKLIDSGGTMPPNLSRDKALPIVGMGFNSLYGLIGLNEADFEEITSDETLEAGVGAVADKMKKMQDKMKKQSTDIARMSENLKMKDSEIKQHIKEKEQAQSVSESRFELERMYGARASKLEDKRRNMDNARKCLADAEQWLFQINILEDDPPQLIQDLADLIRRFHQAHQKAMSNYSFTANLLDD